jgi:putative endonuclease
MKPSLVKSKKSIGVEYEKKAEAHLIEAGYRLLAKNVFYPWGEIDLVVVDHERQELVFVEVRSRKEGSMQFAEETLGYSKLNRLKRAVRTYLNSPEVLLKRNQLKGARIDLIAFEGDSLRHWINFVDRFY